MTTRELVSNVKQDDSSLSTFINAMVYTKCVAENYKTTHETYYPYEFFTAIFRLTLFIYGEQGKWFIFVRAR